MPPRKAHEDKARSIERTLSLLDDYDADHWDWVAILAFYAALHWLDASFADGGLHPSNHRQRNRAVQGLPIWDEYHELYSVSRIARYEAGHITRRVAMTVRDHNLPTVRSWVQQGNQP
jgi:hypothetical protein